MPSNVYMLLIEQELQSRYSNPDPLILFVQKSTHQHIRQAVKQFKHACVKLLRDILQAVESSAHNFFLRVESRVSSVERVSRLSRASSHKTRRISVGEHF